MNPYLYGVILRKATKRDSVDNPVQIWVAQIPNPFGDMGSWMLMYYEYWHAFASPGS